MGVSGTPSNIHSWACTTRATPHANTQTHIHIQIHKPRPLTGRRPSVPACLPFVLLPLVLLLLLSTHPARAPAQGHGSPPVRDEMPALPTPNVPHHRHKVERGVGPGVHTGHHWAPGRGGAGAPLRTGRVGQASSPGAEHTAANAVPAAPHHATQGPPCGRGTGQGSSAGSGQDSGPSGCKGW